jgi:hypothetical protein
MIHFVVGGQNFLRQFHVAPDDGVQSAAHHLLDKLAHTREIHVGLDARVAKNAHGSLRDVHGLITNALEVIVDAGNGQDKAEVNGHELVEREKLDHAVVDLHLQLVDGVFFFEDTLGELLVGIQHGVHRLMDGVLGEAAHPEQPFFQLIQILLKMTFHEALPSIGTYSNNEETFLASPPRTENLEPHPKRPVM